MSDMTTKSIINGIINANFSSSVCHNGHKAKDNLRITFATRWATSMDTNLAIGTELSRGPMGYA
jgi:hypothetical protein